MAIVVKRILRNLFRGFVHAYLLSKTTQVINVVCECGHAWYQHQAGDPWRSCMAAHCHCGSFLEAPEGDGPEVGGGTAQRLE